MKKLIYAAVILLGWSMMASCGGNYNDAALLFETYEENYDDENATASEDYSWIVGTWVCDMGVYGTAVIQFDGDGSSGNCIEEDEYGYGTGSYYVSDNTLYYKLDGESVTTTIEIVPGHRLHAGDGYYYHKR